MPLEFRLLGPLEIVSDGRPLQLGGAKERALLALLLLRPNEAVSHGLLIDRLWTRPPPGAVHALEAHVSMLRKHLRAGCDQSLLFTKPGGYALSIDPDALDLHRFETLRSEGRQAIAESDFQAADAHLTRALGYWRGRALSDIEFEPVALAEAGRLEELRLGALEERADARLALGRHRELVAELESLVAAEPLRERPRGQLMLALYRSGRQTDALELYRNGRRLLVEELGLEPCRELRELQEGILCQDPRLDPPPLVERGEPAKPPLEATRAPAAAERTNRVGSTASDSPIFDDAEVIGRDPELDAIGRFLAGGHSRALVLEGEPGIGKTTLWVAGITRARALGHTILQARPAAVETPFSLAGLGDLLGDVPAEARAALPETHRLALAGALAEGDADLTGQRSRLLGVAVLELLRTLAAERPLLLAIDDLQWLDETSGAIVVYALRRLGSAEIRLLATRRGAGGPLPFGLAQVLGERLLLRIPLEPLSEGAIRRLLRQRLGLDLAQLRLHDLYETVGGNPLFALELARSLGRAEDTGSIWVPRSVEELVGVRLRTLPAAARDGLLFVAAGADQSERVLRRVGAFDRLGPALDADVVELKEGSVRFTHPVLRTVAWSLGNEQRQREVHRDLANAVEDPDQRAWHLASAAPGPDATIAALLEEAAGRAQRRGAPAAAAVLLDRALQLVPDSELDRWSRLAGSAASVHAAAGHFESVDSLVAQAQARLPAGPGRAAILVAAAEMRPGLDALLKQATVEAGQTPAGVRGGIGLAVQAGLGGRWSEAVTLAEHASTLARELGDNELLGVALAFQGGLKLLDSRPAGSEEIAESSVIEDEVGMLPTSVYESPRMWHGAALLFGDSPNAARAIFRERLETSLQLGDDLSAFQFMQLLLFAELHAGNWSVARRVGRRALEHVDTLGYEYGRAVLMGALAVVEACEGRFERARSLGNESLSTLTGFGDRLWSTHSLTALLAAELWAGNPSAALAQADAIAERFPERECWWSYHQGDELEALVLAGEYERALDRVEALRQAGDAIGLPRFLAWASRGDGLVRAALDDLTGANAALEEALVWHERFTLPLERARTQLALGQVLRRRKQRRAARAILLEARRAFEQLGAPHLSASAEVELMHVGGRPPRGEHELTGAEERVARLVASGLSNKGVAAELFVTVSTVEATLTRIYRKLGLTSRMQLARVLAPAEPAGVA